MYLKSAIAAFAFTAALATPASAAIITSTSVGTIVSGYDYINLFGQGVDLGGKTLTLKISYDTALNTTSQQGLAVLSEGTAPFTVSATVGNVTFVSKPVTAVEYNVTALSNGEPDWWYGAPYAMYSAARGSDPTGHGVMGFPLIVDAYHWAYTGGSFMSGTPSLDPGNSYSTPAYGSPDVANLSLSTQFGSWMAAVAYLSEFSVEIEEDAEAVPEPVSVSLLGAGLAGLILSRRRKQGAAAV